VTTRFIDGVPGATGGLSLQSGDLAAADRIHRHPAKMVPALAQRFLERVALPRLAAVGVEAPSFFDPCCGSGTTLLVARIAGCAVYGSDLLPQSATVASAKVNRLGQNGLNTLYKQLRVNPLSHRRTPRWEWDTWRTWYFGPTLRAIQDLAVHIREVEPRAVYPHLWTALSQTCWDVASADATIMVPTHSDYVRGARRFHPDSVLARYRSRLKRIIAAQLALGRLGIHDTQVRIGCGDALDSRIWPRRQQLILTSPPYGLGIDYVRAVSLQGHALDPEFNQPELRRRMIGRRTSSPLRDSVLPARFSREAWCKKALLAGGGGRGALFQYFNELHLLIRISSSKLADEGILGLVVGDPETARLRVPLTAIARQFALDCGLSEIAPPRRDPIRRRFQARTRRSSSNPISHETLLCFAA